MTRRLKPAIYALATLYFLVDAVLLTVAKPIAEWIAKQVELDGLRTWIKSLRPYPTLALFAVPLILLEPVKPVAVYLAASGRIMTSVAVLIIGELLKLVLVERLFSITRDKLMSIPAFAWAHGKVCQAKEWLVSSEAWQAARRVSKIAVQAVRASVAELRADRKPQAGQATYSKTSEATLGSGLLAAQPRFRFSGIEKWSRA